jgi:hypothetical protein
MTTPGPTDPKPAAPGTPGLNPPLPAPTTPTPTPTPPPTPTAPPNLPAPTPPPGTPATTGTPPTPPRPPAPTDAAKPGGAAGAYVLAVFALIIAVAAGAASAYAVKTAWDVRDNGAPAALGTATDAPTDSPSTEPVTLPPTRTPTPSPTPTGPSYVPQFSNVQLQVPGPTGCTAAYVDVDSATVGVDQGHEFYLTTCQGGELQVRVDRTSGRAVSADDDPTPQECAAAATGSGTAELVLPAEEGLTFCLLTNRAQANALGLPQRLAIVTIDSIAANNRVTLLLSTFTINQP